jgi:hypothetical protein
MNASNDRFIDPRVKVFRITHESQLYTDKHYLPSYRLVLLHSYYVDVKHHDKNASLQFIIDGLLQVIDGITPYFYKEKCIEAYSFIKDDKKGIFLIDRTKGCYPLVFYPNDLKPLHGGRDSALKMACLDVYNQRQYFEDTIKNSENWDKVLVNALENKFIYSEKKAA